MLTKPPVPYDLCVYLPWDNSCLAWCLNRFLNVRFQPGEGPSRGLLCDCESSFEALVVEEEDTSLELETSRVLLRDCETYC